MNNSIFSLKNHFNEVFIEIQSLLIEHCKTALNLPDLYDGQNLSKQWFDLLVESVGKRRKFVHFDFILLFFLENSSINDLINRVHNDLFSSPSNDELQPFLNEIFRHVASAIKPLDYFSSDMTPYIGLMTNLARWPAIVKVIFSSSNPKSSFRRMPSQTFGIGRAFEDTLIGRFLAKSCLPSIRGQPFLFFERPKTISERDVEIIAGTMWGVNIIDLFFNFRSNSFSQ